MKIKRAFLLALAAGLVCGSGFAQQSSSSYQQPLDRFDAAWLMQLSNPAAWKDSEIKIGSMSLSSPTLEFLVAPRRAWKTPEAIVSSRNLFDETAPPATFNDFSKEKSRLVVFHLSW